MKIYFSNQEKHFNKHLTDLKSKKVMQFDLKNLVEKTSEIGIDTHLNLSQFNLDFFFDYYIFPRKIMLFKTQWKSENRTMKIGDTILQQVFLPPIPKCSQKIIFGVRIKEVFDTENRKGFSYETLDGHVEKGISTFILEEEKGTMKFKIQTHSSPGNLLSKLVGPIFSVPYQTYCTKLALRNVKRQIEAQ